jgi:hypothetical protein
MYEIFTMRWQHFPSFSHMNAQYEVRPPYVSPKINFFTYAIDCYLNIGEILSESSLHNVKSAIFIFIPYKAIV